jgi:hypothetical protein
MTVGELIEQLQRQDQDKRVVVADTDGAGPVADIQFVDQRNEAGENVITIWVHV